jgi:hypothetical protein
VPGFVAYYAARTGTGAGRSRCCQDQAGTTESTRRVTEFIRQNVSAAAGSAPEATKGETVVISSA